MNSESLRSLIAQWRTRADALAGDDEVMRFRVKARALHDCANELEAALAGVAPPEIRYAVSEIRDYENDGPLESTDLFLEGPGWSLLVNVPVGSHCTYALLVDGKTKDAGTVGKSLDKLAAQQEWKQCHDCGCAFQGEAFIGTFGREPPRYFCFCSSECRVAWAVRGELIETAGQRLAGVAALIAILVQEMSALEQGNRWTQENRAHETHIRHYAAGYADATKKWAEQLAKVQASLGGHGNP